jgi:hypothetical protein
MEQLIIEVKANPYHRAKYDANHKKWAQMGM